MHTSFLCKAPRGSYHVVATRKLEASMNMDQFFRRYFWVFIGSGLLAFGLIDLAASVSEYSRLVDNMGLASIAILVGGVFCFKGLRQVR